MGWVGWGGVRWDGGGCGVGVRVGEFSGPENSQFHSSLHR